MKKYIVTITWFVVSAVMAGMGFGVLVALAAAVGHA